VVEGSPVIHIKWPAGSEAQ